MGRLVPLTVDGLIYASSVVMLDSARKVAVPPLARWLLGLGIAATLAPIVTHGLGHGPSGYTSGSHAHSGSAGSWQR